jgi:GDP-L-fucose synthase
VFLAAATVGGIHANDTYSADFIYQNIMIESNIIHQSYLNKVKKLLFLGSSCIYPKDCPQPIKEDYLLTGSLEETNEAYAIAKIAGLKMCEMYRKQYDCDFISAMPTNLYGINDNYHPENSHVIPALIQRFHTAKVNNKPTVTCWGTGEVYREFLFADDLADALVFVMNNYSEKETINVGTGRDMLIKELANTIKEVISFAGEIIWDTTKPDGTKRKLLETTKLNDLGWKYKTELKKGLEITYKNYQEK